MCPSMISRHSRGHTHDQQQPFLFFNFWSISNITGWESVASGRGRSHIMAFGSRDRGVTDVNCMVHEG